MKTVQRYLVSLDKTKLVNSCINSSLFFPINHQIEVLYCKINYKKFKTDLLDFINICSTLQLPNDLVNEKKIIFLYQKFDLINKISVIYENDLMENQLKTREYPICGLTINEILNSYIAEIPFTMNHIDELMVNLIYYMWIQEIYDKPDIVIKNHNIENFTSTNGKINTVKSLNYQQWKLGKEVWEAKYKYDKHVYQSELFEILKILNYQNLSKEEGLII